MPTYIRYCPACREEYQPHMTQCLDCGGVLEERMEGEPPRYHAMPEAEAEAESGLPPGEYRRVGDGGLPAHVVEPLVKGFVEAGIPVKVESTGYGLCLSVRDEDRAEVIAALERRGVIPIQPDAAVPAVAVEGGPCPACGGHLKPGIAECPECGLRLGAAACSRCEAELSPGDEICAACGHAQDSDAR
jgi:hypothetical protein